MRNFNMLLAKGKEPEYIRQNLYMNQPGVLAGDPGNGKQRGKAG